MPANPPGRRLSTRPAPAAPTFNQQPRARRAPRLSRTQLPTGARSGWELTLTRPTSKPDQVIANESCTDSGGETLRSSPDSGGRRELHDHRDRPDRLGSDGHVRRLLVHGGPTPKTAAALFTCTITNTQRGHIIVDKVTDPSGSTQSFEFDPSWGANFNLTDTATPHDSGALTPGTYNVAEVEHPGRLGPDERHVYRYWQHPGIDQSRRRPDRDVHVQQPPARQRPDQQDPGRRTARPERLVHLPAAAGSVGELGRNHRGSPGDRDGQLRQRWDVHVEQPGPRDLPAVRDEPPAWLGHHAG